jgi:hypothetical protein
MSLVILEMWFEMFVEGVGHSAGDSHDMADVFPVDSSNQAKA